MYILPVLSQFSTIKANSKSMLINLAENSWTYFPLPIPFIYRGDNRRFYGADYWHLEVKIAMHKYSLNLLLKFASRWKECTYTSNMTAVRTRTQALGSEVG